MGSGLHEWALVVFTVLAQTAVGCFILFTLFARTPFGQQQTARLHYAMTALWVLIAIGFTFSTLHLGSPHRAFNALNRIGLSNLSNEIATGSAFFALGGGYWLLATLPQLPETWLKRFHLQGVAKLAEKLTAWYGLMRLAVCVVGVIFIYAMSALYRIPTVPTWNSLFTPINFGLTALIGGSALALTLFKVANIGQTMQKAVWGLGIVGVFVAAVVSYLHYQELSTIQTAIFKATDLVPNYIALMIARIGLLLVAFGLLWLNRQKGIAIISAVAFAGVFVAEAIARILFYSTHMTVGLKALGH